MKKSMLLAGLAAFALFTTAAHAERLTRGVTDVTPTADSRGGSRILFRWDPAVADGDVAIRRATLHFELAGAAEEKSVTVRVYPVTAAWTDSRSTVSFDAELWSHAEIDLRRSGTVAVDVTNVVKEIVEEGLQTHGFVLAADGGESAGLSTANLGRFDGLANATIDVSWRKVPPRPARD